MSRLTTSEQIAAIGTYPANELYYAESDGEPHAKTHYVIHDIKRFRQDCASRKEAKELAQTLNQQMRTLGLNELVACIPGMKPEDIKEECHHMHKLFGPVDVTKLDDWLIEHAGYNPDIEATITFVRRVYGNQAADILEKL